MTATDPTPLGHNSPDTQLLHLVPSVKPIEQQSYEERLISIHEKFGGFFPHSSDEMSMIVGFTKKLELGARKEDAFNLFLNQIRGNQELHTSSDDPNRALRGMIQDVKRTVNATKYDYNALEEDIWGLGEDIVADYGPGFILADHPDADLWFVQPTTKRGLALIDRSLTIRRKLANEEEIPKLSQLGTTESIQTMLQNTTAGDIVVAYDDVVQEVGRRQSFWSERLHDASKHLAVKHLIKQ